MSHLRLLDPTAPRSLEQPLLGGYLLDAGVTSLTGPKSSFKSITAQTLALSLIRQAHFGDAKADGSHTVVYMTPSPSAASQTLRLMSADSDPKSLYVCSPVSLRRSAVENLDGTTSASWSSPATIEFFEQLEGLGKCSLLVVDGLAGLSAGYRLNFDTDAYEFAQALRRLLRHFRAILLVDTAAPQGGLKAAPALLDAIDVDLRLTRFRNARERLSTPTKPTAMLSCFTTRSGVYPASVEIALSAKTFGVTCFPLELTTEDVDAQAPDFLEPVQRNELDNLLRITATMTTAEILNMGRLPRLGLSESGNARYLEGGLLDRIVERIEKHCHLVRDPSMSLPEFMRRSLAHHRDRLVYNHFNVSPESFEESDNDDL